MTWLAVAFALSAALMFGWSTAAMQFDSFGAPSAHGAGALAAYLVRRWRWVSGFVASFAGLALHAAALDIGSLAVVQPVVVTCLVIALLMGDALAGRRPSRATLVWSSVIAAGLAVLLIAAGASKGTSQPAGTSAAVILILGGVGACVCWSVAHWAQPSTRGLLLGAGTGINFGLTAGTLKAVTGTGSVGAALTSWPLYVLIALGVSGFLGNQIAYRTTTLTSSLPILNVTNPLVAVLFGIVAFREQPPTGILTFSLAAVALCAVLVGLVRVARLELADDPQEATPARQAVAA